MKIQLSVHLNTRYDGKDEWLQDFDCKVPGAWREPHWEDQFCTVYTKGGVKIDTHHWGEANVHSDEGWDLPDAEWMSTGRNHHVDPSWSIREWKKEVEVFCWFIDIDTLEDFMAFCEKWGCSYDDGFEGRFHEEVS